MVVKRMTLIAVVAACLGLPDRAPAAPWEKFIVPDTGNAGWNRGSANSTYQEWDTFYQPNGVANFVDADQVDVDPNPDDSVHVWQVSKPNLFPGVPSAFASLSNFGKPHSGTAVTTPGTQAGTSSVTQSIADATAFIIGEGSPGAGNIYAFNAATAFDVKIWNYGLSNASSTRIWLQTHTDGTTIDLSTVKLVDPTNAANLISPSSTEVLFNQEDTQSGFGGNIQAMKFAWDVPGNANEYTVKFGSIESSMSLQYLAVDTFASVPEPATAGLLAVAAAGLLGRRHRRRSDVAAGTEGFVVERSAG